eukprot:125307-Pyramimonas_sp.AAC.1
MAPRATMPIVPPPQNSRRPSPSQASQNGTTAPSRRHSITPSSPKRSDHVWVTDWRPQKSVAAGVEQDLAVFTTRDDHHMGWANIPVDKRLPRDPPEW